MFKGMFGLLVLSRKRGALGLLSFYCNVISIRVFSLIVNLSNSLNYPPRACIINKYLITLSHLFFPGSSEAESIFEGKICVGQHWSCSSCF